MFPERISNTKSFEILNIDGNICSTKRSSVKSRAENNAIFNLVMHRSHAVVFGARVTTAPLYRGWDTVEFDQGHVTKNPAITVLVLLSESVGM